MSIRASKNHERRTLEKCMVGKEGCKVEASVESRIEVERARKEMTMNVHESTLERVLQTYITEI